MLDQMTLGNLCCDVLRVKVWYEMKFSIGIGEGVINTDKIWVLFELSLRCFDKELFWVYFTVNDAEFHHEVVRRWLNAENKVIRESLFVCVWLAMFVAHTIFCPTSHKTVLIYLIQNDETKNIFRSCFEGIFLRYLFLRELFWIETFEK